MYKRNLITRALFGILFIVSCASENKEDITISKGAIDDEVPVLEVKAMKIFLENSASMAGYFSKRTEFSDMMDDLVTKFNSSNGFKNKVETYTICDSIDRYENLIDFQSALRLEPGSKISIGKSSKLDQILELVYQNTGDGEISLLVTDAIMSGTDQQIKQYYSTHQKHYNQEQKNALKNEIFTIADRYRDKYFVTICANKSNFEGTYYKLDNSKLKGQFNSRPYYLIAVGDKKVYHNFMAKWEGFSSCSQISTFGANYDNLNIHPTPYSTLHNTNVSVDLDGEIKLEQNRKNFTFPILMNISALSAVTNDVREIEDDLVLLINGNPIESVKFELLDLKDKAAPIGNRNNPKIRAEVDKNTHFVKMEVSDYFYSKGDVLELAIKKNKNEWQYNWSSEEDFNIDLSFDKTLNLDYFLNGINQAYSTTYLFKQKLNFR